MNRGAQIATVAITSVLVTAGTMSLWGEVEGGPVLTPYQDVAGVWTVCRGHTGPDVIPGIPWTLERCNRQDWDNLIRFGQAVVDCTGNAALSRGQRDALTVFAGNVGEDAFCSSQVAAQVRAGSFPRVESEMLRWIYHSCRSAGGCQYSRGLFNRRMREVARMKEAGPPQIYGPS